MTKNEKPEEPTYMPPADPEAEQAVLGSILVKPQGLDLIIDSLWPEDFYREAHGNIYHAMRNLHAMKKPVDYVMVVNWLKDKGLLEMSGGPAFIAQLSERMGFAANVEYYARIVLDKARLRRLLDAAQKIAMGCFEPIDDVGSYIDEAEAKIFQFVGNGAIKARPLSESVVEVVTQIENLYQNKGRLLGLSTGFTEIDHRTAGLQNSDLIILAARPGMGKSALSMNISDYVSSTAGPVIYFSMEMSRQQLIQRLMAGRSNIPFFQLRTGRLNPEQWCQFSTVTGKLLETPLFIDERGALTAMQIRAEARRLKARHDIKLVVIDYLQLMVNPKARSRENEVGSNSQMMKALAKELNVPVLLLSQLNRDVEKRNDKRPILSDLRDSGQIEQDADVVMFIYRDEVYHPEGNQRGVAEIIIPKQRNMKSGVMAKLAWLEDYVRFENLYTGDEY